MRPKKLMLPAVVLANILFTSASASADTISANFTTLNGAAHGSGGTVTFTLNANGTIAGDLTFLSPIEIFGFESAIVAPAESNFSPSTYSRRAGITGTLYGDYNGGFACSGFSCPDTHVTWTIGNAGQFTSAMQALGGNTASFDFFVGTLNSDQWGANAAPASVPGPVQDCQAYSQPSAP